MRLDFSIVEGQLGDAASVAARARRTGAERVWATESTSDPFLQCLWALANGADAVGTGIAVAFARTPMALAYPSWDLADVSAGRFHLGLGTQVRAHIQRRFGMPWSAPVDRLREYVAALRAIWAAWRDGTELDFQGDYYQHTLMTPVFTPRPHDHAIPVAIAAVGKKMTRLAGEVADGLIVHGFTTPEYLSNRTFPALEEGLASSGRSRPDVEVSGTVFLITGSDQEIARLRKDARRRIAFYASTAGYLDVLDSVGHAELQPELRQLARQQRWEEMEALITDELLDHVAVTAAPNRIAAATSEHFGGQLDRVASYYGWPGVDDDRLSDIVRDFSEAPMAAGDAAG